MLNSKSFAGVTPCGINKSLNMFEELYNDGGRIYLQTVDTYQHVEDGLIFEYKYVLAINDYAGWIETIDPEFPFFAELYIIPTPESLDKKVLAELAGFIGVAPEEVLIYDIVQDGECVMIGASSGLYDGIVEEGDTDEGFKEEDIPTIINLVSNALGGFEMMRGFILDKQINRIGWTGLDVLQKLVNGKELNYYTKLTENTEDQENKTSDEVKDQKLVCPECEEILSHVRHDYEIEKTEDVYMDDKGNITYKDKAYAHKGIDYFICPECYHKECNIEAFKSK